MATTTKTFICELQKDTGGALCYRELDNNGRPIKGDADGAHIGDLYVRKAPLNGISPTKITVSIKY